MILRYYCEKVERTAKIGEEELASCCAKGDSFAREELYNRYATRLTALCSRYTEGPEEAIDLMHDTMCKVFDSIGKFQFRGNGSLNAWMSRMAVNIAIDRLRKKKKLTISYFEGDLPDIEAPLATDINLIPQAILIGFISSLPTTKRLIFNMYCIDELSHKEIAKQLGISEGASRSMLAKAKKQLAGMVKEYLKNN